MRPRSHGSRRTSLVLTAAVATIGTFAAMPAPPALAVDSVTATPSTVANGDTRSITFTTTDAWFALSPPSVTIRRVTDPSKPDPNDTVDGSGESVSSDDNHKVTADFDLTLANPGAYAVEVSGRTADNPTATTTDSCASCLTVVSAAPTVTGAVPNSVSAGDTYPDWAITGANFTKGPYVQCTALPCGSNSPNVAIFAGNSLDANVTLSASDSGSTRTQIPLVLAVAASDPGGPRTIVVTNTDGQSGVCTNCLTIAPAMTVSSITPNHLPSGTTGATLTIAGSNFRTDVVPTFARQSDSTETSDISWGSISVTSTQITLSGVTVSSSAPDGNQDLRLHSDSTNADYTFSGLFSVGGTPPAAVTEGPPTNVQASGGDQQAFVQWTPPPSTESDPITGYTVRTLPNGDPSSPAPASARSATVGPLTNGQSYQFTVTVAFASGQSYTSAASNPATASGRPDAPTNVAATAGDRNATVTWQAPAHSNGTPVDRYTVTASPDGVHATVFAQGSGAPQTSAVVSGLKNGRTYTFSVVAHNKGGNSDDSAPSNKVTPKGNPSITLIAPKVIDKGTSTTPHGRLVSSNGTPIAGASVKLQQRHSGAHQFGTVKVLTTSSNGRWSFEVKPLTTTRYRVRYAGDAGNNPTLTGRTVKVRETGRFTSPRDGAHVAAGTVTVRGHASSAKGSAVALQERRGGEWVTIVRGKVERRGKVAFHATLSKGKVVLRLQVAGELGTVTGYSPRLHLTVG